MVMVALVILFETALRFRCFTIPILTFIAITSSVDILIINQIIIMTIFFVVMMVIAIVVIMLALLARIIILSVARLIAPIQVDVVLVRVCDLEPDVLRHQRAL